MTQPYLSYRCWLLRAQAVSAAPAASFKSASGQVAFSVNVGVRQSEASGESCLSDAPSRGSYRKCDFSRIFREVDFRLNENPHLLPTS